MLGVEQNCEIVQEEVFGPVVTVQIFDTLDEALQLANGVRYGLAASIWTRSLQSIDTSPRELASTSDAMYLANKLDCGLVWVNCWLLRDLRYISRVLIFIIITILSYYILIHRIPFGGTKQSGVGREGGAHRL